MAEPARCALVLLAAGGSSRMGRPKQLLPIGGRPLVRRAAEAALGSPASPVIIVLGASAEEIRPCLDGLAVHVVINDGWQEGLGSSVLVGVQALAAWAPGVEGVVIALADQPGLSAAHVRRLLEAVRQTGRPIAASECGGQLMPPVYFPAAYFPALMALRGDSGARALLQRHAAEVTAVPVADLGDLDTPSDYEAYLDGQAKGVSGG